MVLRGEVYHWAKKNKVWWYELLINQTKIVMDFNNIYGREGTSIDIGHPLMGG